MKPIAGKPKAHHVTILGVLLGVILNSYVVNANESDSSILAQSGVNLAQGKSAKQGATGWGGAASRAVDGNRDGFWKAGSVSHTGKRRRARNNWWQVDLESEVSIGEIKVFNRIDCCTARLNGARVYVGNSPYSGSLSGYQEVKTLTDSESEQSIVLNEPVSGRYVVIKADGKNYLSLAEVEVFAAGGNGVESETDNTAESGNTESSEVTAEEAPGGPQSNTDSMAAMMGQHSQEHMRVFNLVSDEVATHTSVGSGAWEDPATWGGSVPDEGARVIIAGLIKIH